MLQVRYKSLLQLSGSGWAFYFKYVRIAISNVHAMNISLIASFTSTSSPPMYLEGGRRTTTYCIQLIYHTIYSVSNGAKAIFPIYKQSYG